MPRQKSARPETARSAERLRGRTVAQALGSHLLLLHGPSESCAAGGETGPADVSPAHGLHRQQPLIVATSEGGTPWR